MCRGLKVRLGGIREGERAGLLVDPQGQQGRLLRGEGHLLLPEEAEQDGGGRPDLAQDLQTARDILGVDRMVVVDVDLQPRPPQDLFEGADPRPPLHVHQDETRDRLQRESPEPLHPERKLRLAQELPDVPLLGSREQQTGLGIELRRRRHGGQSVEVGVNVRADEFHERVFAARAGPDCAHLPLRQAEGLSVRPPRSRTSASKPPMSRMTAV